MQILRMVQEGKVTAEEAAKLLAAVEVPLPAGSQETGRLRFIRVKVQDGRGRKNVNINLPIGLANLAMRFVPGFAADWDGLLEAIKTGTSGKLMDIEDEDRNTKVEIYVE